MEGRRLLRALLMEPCSGTNFPSQSDRQNSTRATLQPLAMVANNECYCWFRKACSSARALKYSSSFVCRVSTACSKSEAAD